MQSHTSPPDATPCVLTQVSHSGVSALDLATVPHTILVSIASAASAVVAEWANGSINAETDDSDGFLSALSATVNALDGLYKPVVPGREDLMNLGLTVTDDDQGYPVERDGLFQLVKAAELTPVEKAAVRQHLEFNMRAGQESADSFKARLAQFKKEIGASQTQDDDGYVEAPAPDWRLA